MKKILFSTLACLAFTAVSFANNGNGNDLTKTSNKKSEISNKNNEDIINKYREHTLDNLLFYTFKENDKYLNDLEQKDEYDLIPNINEYQSIVNNKNSFSKYNKDQQKICLLDGSIYQMNKKYSIEKQKMICQLIY